MPSASANMMASEYASSPLEQPALHTRISSSGARSAISSGTTSRCRKLPGVRVAEEPK